MVVVFVLRKREKTGGLFAGLGERKIEEEEEDFKARDPGKLSNAAEDAIPMALSSRINDAIIAIDGLVVGARYGYIKTS